jgi:hypothetical protein
VLILLPSSEGKSAAATGPPLDLSTLSMPALTVTRERVLNALVKLSSGRPARARTILGLSALQDAEIELNRELRTSPTASAADVYTGVVYESLGYRTLPAVARRRLDRWVMISSALWGGVRLTDQVPAYRLSGAVALPRLGPVATLWRKPLSAVLPIEAGPTGPVLDLRSGIYAKMWTPDTGLADRVVVARVLHQRPDGSTTVVSHHNKATKGRLVRSLAQRGEAPGSVSDLVDIVHALGYAATLAPTPPGKSRRLDIVVGEL